MKHSCVLLGLGTLAILWIGPQPAVWPQAKPAKVETVEKDLQGFWTLVLDERDGGGMVDGLNVMLPELYRPMGSGPIPRMLLWKISGKKIESGVEEFGKFVPDPGARAFELNDPGTMDIFELDKDGQKIMKKRGRVLYDLKGDYLMICLSMVNGKTPENFAMQPKAKTPQTIVQVFRRGKLERKGAGFVVRDKD